ncbi:MAG: TonB-dependent receptor [Myxococcota bacterium]
MTKHGQLVARVLGAVLLGLTSTANAQRMETDGPKPFLLGDSNDETQVDLEELDLEELLNTTIVSASRQAEPLAESPVPVTVITSEMIRAIAARNLEDVLTVYVPGMVSIEDGNEENVAFRGIYASSQQKFLVMVDGHRLNQRAYLAANPDEGISINPDRIKQIEVLRGPGSAVYGNVALNAVVNIITRDGADIDGMHVRLGAGNHGQRSGDLVYGTALAGDGEAVLWASAYAAEGEEFEYTADTELVGDLALENPTGGQALINAVGSPYNHDVGVKLRKGEWSLFASHRSGRHQEPLTNGGRSGDLYDPDAIRTIARVSPGLQLTGANARLTYEEDLTDSFNLRVDAGFDRNSVRGILANNSDNDATYISWREEALSLIAQGRLVYDLGGVGDGSLVAGAHVDTWWLRDSSLLSGIDGEFDSVVDESGSRLLRKGQEGTYSGFVQLKHAFSKRLLANVGARYDYKTRRRGAGVDPAEPADVDDITVLNPRLALLYSPSDSVDLKLGFSDAFVDSPYWYRYNRLPTFAGSLTLEPERYRSVQFTPTFRFLDGRLSNTLNVAWGELRDGIYRVPDAEPGDVFYLNSGVLESVSVEEEIAFVESWYRLRGNATFFQVLEVEEYTAFDENSPRDLINQRDFDGHVWHVPRWTANVIVDVNPLADLYRDLWLNVTVQYIGSRQAPITRVSRERPNLIDNRLNEEPDVVLLHAGLRWTNIGVDGLGVQLYGRNILDEQWSQGGATAFPYPQPGFWYLAQLEYHFSP